MGASVTNVTLSVLKDKAFARMFGTGVPKSMPVTSMGLFAVRDSMTILASFSLPGIVSAKVQRDYAIEKSKADTMSQLLCPVAMQVLSSPLHLIGLDWYNRDSVSTSERVSFVQREYLKTTAARMTRIFPAFGM